MPVRQEFGVDVGAGSAVASRWTGISFSGHSPRNYLTSAAALLGFSKDMRAYLGRWAIGMTSSEEYVRTARQVVTRFSNLSTGHW